MVNYNKEIRSNYLPLQNKYRSRMEIIALILEATGSDGAALYPLMKRTSINYTQLKKYLPALIKIGFMEKEIKDGRVSFRVSERGVAFLRQYNILQDILLGAYVDDEQINVTNEENNFSKIPQRVIPLSAQVIKRRQRIVQTY